MTQKSPKQITRAERDALLAKFWKVDSRALAAYLIAKGAQKVTSSGQSIKLCCPFHQDSSPSAVIHLDKKFFYCFGGNCGHSTGDILKVVQKLGTSSYLMVADEYRANLKLTDDIKTSEFAELNGVYLEQHRLNLLSDVFNTHLCNVWQAPANDEKRRASIGYLKARGIKDPMHTPHLGLLPRLGDVDALIKARVPADEFAATREWVIEYLDYSLSESFSGWLTFTYAVGMGEVTFFKIRKPDANKEITTLGKDKSADGMFGLDCAVYGPLLNTGKNLIHVVEGEFDQLALHGGQIASGVYDAVYVAASGSGNRGLDCLSRFGLNTVNIVPDNDEGGIGFARGLIERTRQIHAHVFTWPVGLRSTNGPDLKIDPAEAVTTFGWGPTATAIVNSDNYTPAYKWLFNTWLETASVKNDDVGIITGMAVDLANKLADSEERRALSELFKEHFPIIDDKAIVQKSVAQAAFTNRQLIEKAASYITDRFHVIGVDRNSSDLLVWDPLAKSEMNVDYSKNSVGNKLSGLVGDVTALFKDKIGLTPTVADSLDSPEASLGLLCKTQKELDAVLRSAVSSVASSPNVKSLSDMTRRGQGVHFSKDEHGEPIGYIVNGNKFFSIQWNSVGNDFSKVTELRGPSHGNFVFNSAGNQTTSTGWAPYLREVDLINEAVPYTLEQCVSMSLSLIKAACGFKYQEVDATYVAMHPFYSVVADSVQRKATTHFYAQASSGKTTTLGLVAKAKSAAEFSLNDHALYSSNYTAAGFIQLAGGSTMTVALDEFNPAEDSNPNNNSKYQSILTFLRELLSGQASRATGNLTGKGSVTTIYSPIIIAGGMPLENQMDLSRMVQIQFVHDSSRKNTVQLLKQQQFTPTVCADLRRSITHHMLRRMPQYVEKYNALQERFLQGNLPEGIERQLGCALLMAAVLELAGIDSTSFVSSFVETRKQVTKKVMTQNAGTNILDAIMETSFEMIRDGSRQRLALRNLMADSKDRLSINEAGIGVHFDEATKCMGVVWPQVAAGLLAQSVVRNRPPQALATLAARAPEHLETETGKGLIALANLRRAGLGNTVNYSVFDMTKYVQEAESYRLAPAINFGSSNLTNVNDVNLDDTGLDSL